VVAVDVDPPAHSVRAVALHAPNGELTLLMVNRYGRPLKATLQVGLEREVLLRLYRYTRENVPAEVPKVPKVPKVSGGRGTRDAGRGVPDSDPSSPVPRGGMIGAADALRVAPGAEVIVDLPAESFVLLTEVR
jgi:hypothetical protein